MALIVGEFEDLVNLLHPLHALKEATITLEADKTPTAHIVMRSLVQLFYKDPRFQEKQDDPLVNEFTKTMLEYIAKRVDDKDYLLEWAIAMALDPR